MTRLPFEALPSEWFEGEHYRRQYWMSLTPMERSVLLALLSGKTEKEIGHSLEKSHNTVHIHVKSIYRKFGVRNRPALTALWLGKGVSAGK